jgi:hypothetical protein
LAAGIVLLASVGGTAAGASDQAVGRTPGVKWTRLEGPVPGAVTAVAPALTVVAFPGNTAPSTVLFWTGPPGKKSVISYATAESLSHNKWTQREMVLSGKAQTKSRPSVTRVGKAFGGKLIVAWTPAAATAPVLYSVGTPEKGRRLSWGPELAIPRAFASDSPAIFSSRQANVVIAAWTAAGTTRLFYDIGILQAKLRSIKWSTARVLPDAAARGTPTIAEANFGNGRGLIYLLWKGLGKSSQIQFSTTTDPLSPAAIWQGPITLPKGIITSQPPVGESIGAGASYPLLIVYQTARGNNLRYITMARSGKVTGPLAVPSLRSVAGPALAGGVLAAVSHSIDYLAVRPCPSCGQ